MATRQWKARKVSPKVRRTPTICGISLQRAAKPILQRTTVGRRLAQITGLAHVKEGEEDDNLAGNEEGGRTLDNERYDGC